MPVVQNLTLGSRLGASKHGEYSQSRMRPRMSGMRPFSRSDDSRGISNADDEQMDRSAPACGCELALVRGLRGQLAPVIAAY